MLNILFVHMNPEQFRDLHKYLLDNRLANSYLLCGETFKKNMHFSYKNVYSFKPEGDPFSLSYYYSGWAEQGAKISKGVHDFVSNFIKAHPIDVIISYSTLGASHLLFDSFNIPHIVYIEFPSYRQYGYDSNYPPTKEQKLNDVGLEMLSYYQVIRSSKTIVPTYVVKNMFPKELHDKIVVQMDGLDVNKSRSYNQQPFLQKNNQNTFYIGFSARVISSQKGFEQFIKISKKLLEINENFHFVIKGSETGESYGYENLYTNGKSFKDFIVYKYQLNLQHYSFYDFLKFDDYNNFINDVHLFLYPLVTGSNNYGFFDLLLRGKIIVASERSFLPEIIRDGHNGFICEYDNIDSWCERIMDIYNNYEKYSYIKNNAIETASNYSLENVAQSYLRIIDSVVHH